MTRACLLMGVLICLLTPGWGARQFFYTGTIGKYAMQMDLTIDGVSLHGTYHYLALGEELVLNGTRDGLGKMTLREQDKQGTRTGKFLVNISPDDRTIHGTWINVDGKRKLPVSCMALAEYQTIQAQTPGLTFSGFYPRFFDRSPVMLQLNTGLVQQMSSIQQHWQLAMAGANDHATMTRIICSMRVACSVPARVSNKPYTSTIFISGKPVAGNYPGLVSVLITETSRKPDDGAAQISYASLNYALINKQLYPLKLDDLFDVALEGAHTPASYVEHRLARLGEQDRRSREVKISEDMLQAFTLSPIAITFYFSDAERQQTGSSSVSLPYTLMEDIIGLNTVLTPFVTVTDTDPVTDLNAEEALKLGPDKFYVLYTNRTKDLSIEGMRRAYISFCELVMPQQNDPETVALPEARGELYTKVYNLTNALDGAQYYLQMAWSGHGAMYEVMTNKHIAHRAETLANMLPILRAPATASAVARACVVKNLSAIDAGYARLLAQEKHAASEKDYYDALLRMSNLCEQTHTLARQLPDAAAASFTEFMKHMVMVENTDKQ